MINDTGVVLKSLVPALAALHLGGRLRDCLQAAIHLSTEVRVFLRLNDKNDWCCGCCSQELTVPDFTGISEKAGE